MKNKLTNIALFCGFFSVGCGYSPSPTYSAQRHLAEGFAAIGREARENTAKQKAQDKRFYRFLDSICDLTPKDKNAALAGIDYLRHQKNLQLASILGDEYLQRLANPDVIFIDGESTLAKSMYDFMLVKVHLSYKDYHAALEVMKWDSLNASVARAFCYYKLNYPKAQVMQELYKPNNRQITDWDRANFHELYRQKDSAVACYIRYSHNEFYGDSIYYPKVYQFGMDLKNGKRPFLKSPMNSIFFEGTYWDCVSDYGF